MVDLTCRIPEVRRVHIFDTRPFLTDGALDSVRKAGRIPPIAKKSLSPQRSCSPPTDSIGVVMRRGLSCSPAVSRLSVLTIHSDQRPDVQRIPSLSKFVLAFASVGCGTDQIPVHLIAYTISIELRSILELSDGV